MLNKILFFGAMSFLCGTVAYSSESALLKQIEQNNKELQIAKANMVGENAQAKSENNLPDPEIELESMVAPETSWEFSLSEQVEWPGIYASRHKAIKHRMSAQQFLYESTIVNIRKQVRFALCDIIDLNRQVNLLEQMYKMLNTVLTRATKDELRSEFTIVEITKFKLKALTIAETLRNLRIRKQNLISSLVTLNGGNPITGVDFGQLSYPIDIQSLSYYVDAYKKGPDYKVRQQETLAAKYDLSATKRSYFPNLKLGYKFSKNDIESGHTVVFGISIPVFSNRHKVVATKAAHTAAILNADKDEFEARQRIQVLYDELMSLDKAISDYESVLNHEDLKSYLDMAFEKDAITALRYLNEYEFLAEAKEKLNVMKYEFANKYIELSKYNIY